MKLSERLPGETSKQFSLRLSEEKLAEITHELRKLEREKSYWERAVAYQKLEEEQAA